MEDKKLDIDTVLWWLDQFERYGESSVDYACSVLIAAVHIDTFREVMRSAIAYINHHKSTGVETVKYAEWVNNTFCSNCKRFPVDVSVPISNQELTKYFSRCPHCGAHMR